ncbi:6-hydroxymethylpterin diphosphokinase MptE-like protein [Treponema sp.]|jgi:hypothetical protein|uniref:6-hydroxymethylpterin diphosphokinase MptE-like protein n=1 Tax=Treponema sp. TaxID=166 RepID=UPI00257C0D73|nr:6-hydroxymethylpterin diphosphokinase MptE-like protein [Treponema sp.]MBE6354432.1 DUF115 domain-containing protein [Treponema sp.]
MTVEFFQAGNGEKTCKINNLPLHSAYEPSKEAERYVKNAVCKFKPKFVLVVEPGLSYCAPYLRQTFPDSKICCVRLCNEFSDSDSQWDKVFYFYSTKSLDSDIFNYMGDEGIIACFFWTWPGAQNALREQNNEVWEEIKKAVLKTKSILNTRRYFAKRWTKNALRFCLFSKYNAYILKGNSPVIVCASGPSLRSSIPFLKKYREQYFLVAVSSALSPLIDAEIIPDVCISTDGGYWAKLHLEFGLKRHNIPLVLPLEGACYGEILSEHTVVPVAYGDGVGEKLIDKCNYINVKAIRNGTVSGTAADFALSITSGEVFFCGLDLSPSKGFAHTQPNELEINDSIHDNRLRTQETRVTPHTFNSPALDIYRAWFSSNNFFHRVFRLSDDFKYNNSLGQIPDVNWKVFKQHIPTGLLTKPTSLFLTHEIVKNERIKMLLEETWHNLNDKEWIKSVLPNEEILYERSKPEEKEVLEKKIKESMEEFAREIQATFEKGLKS